jgi:hypothetical protein
MANVDEDRVRRIEELVARVESFADSEARETAAQLMQAVLELHGTGLERMMDLAFESGPNGEALIRRFAGDDLVSSLLILHGLHPDDLETRVRHFLTKLPGHPEWIGCFEGVIRIRVAADARDAVESVLRQVVPDAAGIVIEPRIEHNGFIPVESIGPIVSRTG